jgi:hypothetical protein
VQGTRIAPARYVFPERQLTLAPLSARRRGLPRLRRLALALLALGVFCRLVRYGLHFPFWGDETCLCVNLLGRDYLGLTRLLEGNQVAPLFFLWGELTAYRLLGPSELALRLLPLLAGLASLGLFWYLARSTLGPRAAALAVGLLAVARWPVTMSAAVKPYSCDLFFSLALLIGAVHHLRRPERVGWLALLALLVPVAVLSSYPSVFVAGGISLALLPSVWRGHPAARGWYVVYNLLMIGTFLGSYLLVGREQLDPAASSVEQYMQDYWRHGFPPADIWDVPIWFVKANAGRLMAYPIGDGHGGSTVTLLLFLVGAYVLARRRRGALLALCLLPFALNLVAAALHRYPYGGCCRISQHLAPAICLLAGTGLVWTIDRVAKSTVGRARGLAAVCGLLALFGVGEVVADVARPYRDPEALWSEKLTRLLLDRPTPGDQVVVWNAPEEVEPLLRWHLGRHGKRLRWGGDVDWERLERDDGLLWCVSIWSGPEETPDADRHEALPTVDRPGWVLLDHAIYTLPPWNLQGQPLRRCEVSRWARVGEDGSPRRRPALGSYPP